ANELQASMDVEAGPLVKAGLFKTNEGDHLLLIIHHLVVDGVSWRILLEDFMYGYQAAREGKPIELPDKTTSFQEWAKKQYEYVNSSKMEKEEAYWRKLVEEPLDQIPRDGEPTKAVWKDMTTRTITLSQEATTKLLKETNRAYNTEINDILLSALGLAVKEWCGAEKIAIALEGHGREEIVDGVDTTRTVGWFTSCYPVILEMRDREIGMVIKRTKENLRKVPNKGIGYGMLTQLTGNNSTDLKIQADISFNYLGQFDQDMTDERITYSHLSTGNNASPDLPSWNSIQINSMVKQNELCIMVDFHEKEFKEQTINRFMKIYEDMLQKTIQHCQARQETEQTPSDYGVNDYTLEDLEEIKAYVSEQIGENAVPGKINKLTPMQEGMLFTYLQEKDTTAYVLQTEFKLKGYVDAKRLNAVYNSLLRRYEVLRTVILNHWKHPSQIILDYREQQIEYQDFSQESNKEEQYKQAIDAKVEQGFDLSKDLLFTITLIKMSEDDYRLISTCHHIIIDGWSNSIILNEMFKAYRQMASGGLTEAPALNTYDSYIKWLFQQDEQQGLSFWSNYLQGYNKESIIPGNENSMPGYIEAEVTNKLSHELTQKLRTLCSENEVTFNTLCQAAWGMLLQKHTGNQDVVFGAVVSGRPPEIEGIDQMVGIFLNTIPVRVTVNNQTTIKQLLSDMQDKGNVAKSYEYLPLADIQNLSHRKQKLIETLMVFENYPIEELENNLNGEYESTFSVQEVSGREKTDYHLNIIFILRNELTYKILYNEQVYPAALIDRLSNQLAMIFEKVSACPEELVENVEIISQQEKEAITSFIEEYEQDLMAFGEGDFQFNMDED
ncbi:condensation domain-containing protein, partial [Brevibacillus sp. SYSU BS000544]|uniref:condensation domain-containing protein n=1 Tax=Brevibacillus sp. SYSU BS000544 TaxID=3416443 RepID=UPI003CE577CA